MTNENVIVNCDQCTSELSYLSLRLATLQLKLTPILRYEHQNKTEHVVDLFVYKSAVEKCDVKLSRKTERFK